MSPVVWVSGPPASGKTTLARRLTAKLREAKTPSLLLDGDEVRNALVPRPGYAPEERDAFYDTLARLAALCAAQNLVVVVAATAHLRVFRERARSLSDAFIEVELRVPPGERAARDVKGLYALAKEGAAPHLPGTGAVPFEPSLSPDVVAAGGFDDEALDRICALL